MRGFIVRRLMVSVLTAWLASVAVFLVMRAVPGNIVQQMMGQTSDPTVERELRAFFGMDRPLYAQYWSWLANVLHGDLGNSWNTGRSVVGMIHEAFLVTLELSVLTLVLATAIGVPLGMLAGIHQGRTLDTLTQAVTVIGLSTPVFWLGAMLLIGMLATTGWSPPLLYVGPTESIAENLRMLALPVLSLTFLQAAAYAQFVRQSVASALHERYVQTATAKGLPISRIFFKHVLRNIAISLITFISLIFIQILGGAVVIESLFALPGLGRLLLTSIEARDFPVVQGGLLLVVAVTLLINLLVDILYHFIDPRLRV